MIEALLKIRCSQDREPYDPGLEALALASSSAASPEVRARAAKHLASHPEDAEALLLLQSFDAEERRPKPLLPRALWALAASIAIAAWMSTRDRDRSTDTLLPMGGEAMSPTLDFAVERNGERTRLAAGARVRAGDRVRFFYTTEEEGYMAVVHVDGAKHTTWMFPNDLEGSARITPGRQVALAGGAMMEDGDGCEWFVAVFSPRPLLRNEIEAQLAAARAGSNCALDVDLPEASAVRVFPVRTGGSP